MEHAIRIDLTEATLELDIDCERASGRVGWPAAAAMVREVARGPERSAVSFRLDEADCRAGLWLEGHQVCVFVGHPDPSRTWRYDIAPIEADRLAGFIARLDLPPPLDERIAE